MLTEEILQEYVKDLQNYTGKKYEENSLPATYVESALNIINSYLGYDPDIKFNTEYFMGDGTNKIQLKAKPIDLVYSIKDMETGKEIFIADKNKQEQDYYITEEFVELKKIIPKNRVQVGYVSGYGYLNAAVDVVGGGFSSTIDWYSTINCGSSTNDFLDIISGGSASTYIKDFNPIDIKMPSVFKQTILRIAALLQTESDNNIGITGKSFGDSGSRTFTNYTNFSKYLDPLSKYKLITI
jgi:hypothetical protein